MKKYTCVHFVRYSFWSLLCLQPMHNMRVIWGTKPNDLLLKFLNTPMMHFGLFYRLQIKKLVLFILYVSEKRPILYRFGTVPCFMFSLTAIEGLAWWLTIQSCLRFNCIPNFCPIVYLYCYFVCIRIVSMNFSNV